MTITNHYETLEVSSSASQQEVKKAYRKLALLYHPDKNPDDKNAEERFRDIQEAYAVIGTPEKRREYDNRYWFSNGRNTVRNTAPLTPLGILKDSIRLRQYVFRVNIFSIDQEALNFHILRLLSATHLETLMTYDNPQLTQQVIRELITASTPLKYRYLEQITQKITRLAGNDAEALQETDAYIKKRKHTEKLNRYAPLTVLVIVILLCWLIYLYGK